MKRKVLAVDTDADLLDAICPAIVAAGFEVARARDAIEALRNFDKFKPDLVITEIALPKLDGFDMARALKAKPATTEIPVIFISAKTDKETLEIAKNLGAKKFLAKPIDIEKLIAVVKILLPDQH